MNFMLSKPPLQKRGLNGFQLKLLALMIMTVDHIHYFFSALYEAPQILTLIGRIAAPLFVFMVAQGFAHTHSKAKYLLRLYVGATFMQFGNMIINALFPLPGGAIVINGIFATMTCIIIYLMCIEGMRKARQRKHWGKMVAFLFIMIFLFAAGFLCISLFPIAPVVSKLMLYFLPMPMIAEGGILFVIMGIGMYYCRNSKIALSIFYSLLVLAFPLLAGPDVWTTAIFMWLALPFMLLYNGQRGRGMKYLFYIYYPAHVYTLAMLVSLLSRT